jgi:putative ABC transport system substrate-binding protein
MIGRRAIMSLLGGAATWPIVSHAQQTTKRPIIGYLGIATLAAENKRVAAFSRRLHELGWIEGSTATIEFRWAEGRTERAAEIAAEFVRLKVDIVVTAGNAQVLALQKATSIIPIVFAAAGDPLGGGLVASLARPGGNVTGLSLIQTDLASKRLEILREIIPGLRGLAIMGNFSNPVLGLELREVQTAARLLGVETLTVEIGRTDDIAPAFDALKGRAEALYLSPDILIVANRARINILALVARLPTIYNSREYVEEGGLVSYGPDFADLYRRAAEFVDKILRGAKPGDIPVEQPAKLDFAVNVITAKALGLDIPPTLLARADEVIE